MNQTRFGIVMLFMTFLFLLLTFTIYFDLKSLQKDIIKSYETPDTSIIIRQKYNDTVLVKKSVPQWLKIND